MSTPRNTSEPSLIRLLDASETLPSAGALRATSYDLLRLSAGAAVVDVGCGTGRAAAELSQRGMRVVGVDLSEQMLAAARDRWPGNDFRCADATALPLQDFSMDGYRADKVFHELAEPAAALTEARRVLAPGGRVVLVGQDWESFIIDSDDPGLTRTIVTARASAIVNPRIARGYRNVLLDNGFVDVAVEVHAVVFVDELMVPMLSGLAENACAAGAVTREQADSWIAEQTHRGRSDRLMLAMPLFFAAATKPSVAVTIAPCRTGGGARRPVR